MCLPGYFPECWPPGLSSRFFTGISRRRYIAYVYNGEMFSLIGNQRVGIFPSKSKILFYLSLALIWCQNFQDRTIPVGGDTWTSCSAERRKSNEKETYASVCEAVRNKHGSKVTGPSRDRPLLEVMRPSADCQTTFFRRFKQFGNILEKVAERSCDSGWRSRDRRPTVKQRFFDVSSN